MMSWSSFSQTAIDSSKIQLTKPVAKLVVKDLITADGLKLELKTVKEVLEETNNKLDWVFILPLYFIFTSQRTVRINSPDL